MPAFVGSATEGSAVPGYAMLVLAVVGTATVWRFPGLAWPPWLGDAWQVLLTVVLGLLAFVVLVVLMIAVAGIAIEAAVVIAAGVLLVGSGLWEFWIRSQELLTAKGALDGWDYAKFIAVTLQVVMLY
ncbi:MAG: hypothetical protein H7Z42_04205 [Roseiflexaceae bacterium]|nr:hypothetical protein [Roseiflexaceae bacterium]